MSAGRLRHRVSIQRKLPMPTALASGDLYISDSTYQWDGSLWSSVSLPTLVAAINAYSGSEEFTVYVGNEPPLSGDALSLDLTAADAPAEVTYTHPGGKYVEGADGNLVASAENEWILEYRDGVPVGRSVWEARTNLLLWSEGYSQGGGSFSVTITPNTAVAPDGEVTADTIERTGGSGSAYKSFTLDADAVCTYSVFLEAGNQDAADLLVRNDTDGTNLDATGSVISGDGIVSGSVVIDVTGLAADWTRIGVTTSGAAQSADLLRAYVYPFSTTSSPVGIGSTVIAWGSMVEPGASFPGPYIKTEGAAVTRPAESPSFTLGSEYNSAGFTFRVAGESAAGIDGRQVYLSLNDGTTNNRVSVYRDTDRTLYLEVTKAGVQQCLLDMGTLADSTAFSLAARIAPDDMAASLGVTEVTGTGEVPTLTTGNIGHELGADQCNSLLTEVAIEPKQSLWHNGTDLYYGNPLLWTDTENAEYASAVAEWGEGTHTAFYEAPTSDEFGQPTDEWTGWKTLWAAVEPIRGRELYESSQRFGALSTRIVIRYLAGVDETQRIKFGERYFSLVSPPINKEERNIWLELMCMEGPQDE